MKKKKKKTFLRSSSFNPQAEIQAIFKINFHIYHSPSTKSITLRGRAGKPKIFSPEEIQQMNNSRIKAKAQKAKLNFDLNIDIN